MRSSRRSQKAPVRGGDSGQVGHDERPVEEESGDEEEDRDADLEAGGVHPDAGPGPRGQARDEGHVDADHGDGGDGPQAVEGRVGAAGAGPAPLFRTR